MSVRKNGGGGEETEREESKVARKVVLFGLVWVPFAAECLCGCS